MTGNSLQEILISPGFGQEIQFKDVRVDAAPLARGGTETPGFIVSFTVEPQAETNVDVPLWEVHATQDFAAGANASTSVKVGALAEAGAGNTMKAIPSITRGATQLRFARPTDGPARVDVYDVSGRIVRTLDVPVGSLSAAWDGRTASGLPASAGVYFARLAEKDGSAMARVVLVR